MGDGEDDGEQEMQQSSSSKSGMSYAMQQFIGDDSVIPSKFGAIPEDGECGFSDDEYEIEETKTKFTEYSMSSSVMRRSEHLTNIDDTFEEFFDEFDDVKMGELEHRADDIAPVQTETSEQAEERI